MNVTQNKFLFCKEKDWAAASAAAIDDNAADRNLYEVKTSIFNRRSNIYELQ